MKTKVLLTLILAGVSLLPMGNAAAAGNIWMDKSAEVEAKDYQKVILYPIRYRNERDPHAPGPGDLDGYDNYLHKRLNKKMKKVNFFGFSPMLEEKNRILRDNPAYEHLKDHFDSEEARSKAVYAATAADGYLLPHIRWDNQRVDHSPETWVNVQMESYTDVENGPAGDKSGLNYNRWWTSHCIPGHDSVLQMLDMDYTLYDATTGRKAMTLVDYYRCYDVSEEHAFKQVANHFVGDWYRQKNDHAQKGISADAPVLGFRELSLPAEAAQDEFAIKTIYYAFKDEAGDQLKNFKVDDMPNAGQYYVTGDITEYRRGETWNPPCVTTSVGQISEEKRKWYDKNNVEQTMKIKKYATQIYDHYGYYSFYYRVGAHLKLVNAKTGEVVYSKKDTASDSERYANALRSILKDFYRDIDKLAASSLSSDSPK